MQATQRHRQGKVTIWRLGKRCTGSSKADYDRDFVRIVLPDECLGDPTWVSLSLTAWSVDRTFVWEDNAFQRGFRRHRYTPQLKAG